MGLVFNLDPLLDRLNATRRRQGRADLTWAEIAPLLGMSRQALQNLARNRELRATNSRFIEAICRFFRCRPDQLLVLAPAVGGDAVDQDVVDRLVALRRELNPAELPPYHADVLYGEEATARWPHDRAAATEAGPA